MRGRRLCWLSGRGSVCSLGRTFFGGAMAILGRHVGVLVLARKRRVAGEETLRCEECNQRSLHKKPRYRLWGRLSPKRIGTQLLCSCEQIGELRCRRGARCQRAADGSGRVMLRSEAVARCMFQRVTANVASAREAAERAIVVDRSKRVSVSGKIGRAAQLLRGQPEGLMGRLQPLANARRMVALLGLF